MVNEQGENLDIISEEIMKTNKNVVETNNHMDDANTLQKKARRKTMWIVGIILVCIIIVGGIIWIATWSIYAWCIMLLLSMIWFILKH